MHDHFSSMSCHCCSRRRFLSHCAACAGAAALGRQAAGAEQAACKPKVRLVFCETTNDKPIWPNIGYDFDARRNRMIDTLTKGCPDLEFLVTKVMDDPNNAAPVLEGDGDVQGYMICLQGLGWRNEVTKLCATGKPTLVVDNLFGGSGLFLTRLGRIVGEGKPVDWVSSSNDEDIVASARQFALIGKCKDPCEVAAAFRATRHKRTPKDCDMTCKDDCLPKPNFDEAFKKIAETKLLVVGGGWGGNPFRKAAQELLGLEFVPIDFKELGAAYDKTDPAAGGKFADSWMEAAQEVVEPDRAEIERSGRMYQAMKKLLDKHCARGISINCLGGFYGGHLKAYPCLGFAQLNNDGMVGGCEADQMSALTMATMGALTGRPGYISDPVMDTSKNEIIYAHCVAMTKPFGSAGPSNPFRIRDHSEDRKGAAIQSLLPVGYMTTTMEINPVSRQVLIHQAKTSGNNPSDLACRTKLAAVLMGDIEKLTEKWRMGWHRVTFYGDLRPHARELCQRLKLELIEEA